VRSASDLLESGGTSALNRMGQQWINSLKPSQPAPLRALQRLLGGGSTSAGSGRRRGSSRQERIEWLKSQGKWQGEQRRRLGGWTRQEWLDNRWRRDWRSQPRVPAGTDAGGEWMEGRLDYQISAGSTVSRKQRQKRTKLLKAYKRRMTANGIKARDIKTSWGRY